MGTNYHFREPSCVSCGRYVEVHVGKQSSGWSFSFRGYREPEPLGRTVESRADWLAYLTGRSGDLFDEYGARHNAVAFVAGRVAPPAEQQAKERAWLHSERFVFASEVHDWRDAEGFRFCDVEFS